ncbi:MAG: glycosyltransferase [Candidatus Thermoplasmatota archaeon]|nr:glycosyltransferase [Candidatus Thermoplasmatota archaeon]
MNKKVAFLIGSLSGGGAERVVSNLSCNLNDDIEQYILNYSCENAVYPYNGTLIKLKPCKRGTAHNPLRKLYYLFHYANSVRKIKSQCDINTTISFMTTSNLLNIISGGKGIKIVSVRSQTSKRLHGFYGKVNSFLIKNLYNRSDIIVAVSKGVKNDLIHNFQIDPNKIIVIYNPYDSGLIQQLMIEELDKKNFKIFQNDVVLTMGRLTPIKGHKHLIRCFKKVIQFHPNAKIVILGSGECEDHYQDMIKKLKFEDSVFIINFQKNPFKYIHRSKLFVLSSLSEGFPNALLEAMICGTPVVSTDCKSGPREILAPDTDIEKQTKLIDYAQYGILIPVCYESSDNVNDPLSIEEDLMADTIITMLKDNALREDYSNKGKQRSKEFELCAILTKWEKIIGDINDMK